MHPKLKNFLLYVFHYRFKAFNIGFLRVFLSPRFKNGQTRVNGRSLYYVDSASFLSNYREIFFSEIYKFSTDKRDPYILDCGSNIGLSILYFKQLYPHSTIIGFEPDAEIYDILLKNISENDLSGVQLINKGIWNDNRSLSFAAEGGDGGRISDISSIDDSKIVTIEVCRLREFLVQKIDFLKIDIEGAEIDVILDCHDLLINVQHLFVEFHSFKGKLQKLHTLLSILTDTGFRYYIENSGVRSKRPFESIKYALNMDLQLNIFAHRHENSDS